MNPLDRLEKRFRALFETSASLLPWSNPNDRIVHELCVAIQDLFIGNNIQNQVDAPLFLVNLNPITYHRWREQPDWQATLTYLLTSIAAEFGSHFLKTPLIELRADPALLEDEVSIFLKEIPKNCYQKLVFSPAQQTNIRMKRLYP